MRRYADPEIQEIPDFGTDILLAQTWGFMARALDRDDEKYGGVCAGRKYSAYCGACKRNGEIPLPREEWEEQGQLTYTQLKNAGKCEQMRANAANAHNARKCEHCEPIPDPDPIPIPTPSPKGGMPANRETEETIALPPAIAAALGDWRRYQAEKQRRLNPLSERQQMIALREASEAYGDEAVVKLIRQCIARGWDNIIFERLARHPEEFGVKGADPSPGGRRREMQDMATDEEIRKYAQELRNTRRQSNG